MTVLAVDVGTSGVRAALVLPDSSVEHVHHRHVLPTSPMQGFVEFDAAEIAEAVVEVSTAALAGGRRVDAVGISSQRASAVVWDRATGEPVGPGIGWQDLRTVGYCLALQSQGIRLAPNQSATKFAVLLDIADPNRSRDLCVGHGRLLGRLDPFQRRGLHVSDRTQPRRHRPARRQCRRVGRGRARGSAHPPFGAAPPCGLHGSGGRSRRSAGCPAHRRPRRRPAGFPRRPGMRPAGSRQGDLRHGGDARPLRRRQSARIPPPRSRRHLPDRGLEPFGASSPGGSRRS